jgi:hypothetical protein
MRERFDWIRRILIRPGQPGMLALLTPPRARNQPRVVRYLLAGATVATMGVAAAVGLCAFAVLMFALAAIYFLATQVLGIEVNVDPRAFYEQLQRTAAAGAAGAYGPN